MATHRNPSQYITLVKQFSAHNPDATQASQTNLSDFLAFPCPPDPWEYGLKSLLQQLIHPSPKLRMTETPVQKPVHMAYSPIASMNYQWTINLHDGYPLLQGIQLEEYITHSLHTLCNHKPTIFHLGDDYLCPSKILLPPGDNGENLEAAANKKTNLEH